MSLLHDDLLSPVSLKTKQLTEVLLAEQKLVDELENEIEQQQNQLYVASANTMLSRYEDILDISSNTGDSITTRQNRIIAKLNAHYPATKLNIERIVSIITGTSTEIIEHFSNYTMEIKVSTIYDNNLKILNDVIVAVNEIKPAHIGYQLTYVYESKGSLFVGAYSGIARTIEITPLIPRIPESNAYLSIGGYMNIVNTINIMPKEDSYEQHSIN